MKVKDFIMSVSAACVMTSSAFCAEDVKDFVHDVTTEKKPWTHTDFRQNGSGDFSFAIIGDRSGRPAPGVFEKGLAEANRLGPDFIMSVGDFIEGICVEDQSDEFLMKQWGEFEALIKDSRAPFFRIVGNHDIPEPGDMFPDVHDRQTALWNRLFGTTYYSFVRKNVLFLNLWSTETREGISDKQLKWALETIKKHSNVRWTMVFLHLPAVWKSKNFGEIEKALYDRNYTVFAGDYHQYVRYNRNGRHYYMLGPSGGGWDTANYNARSRGKVFGEIHHITWVSFQDGIPQVTILPIEEMEDGDMVTTEKITWLTPKYFRGNQKLSAEELKKLKDKGLHVTDKE